MTPGMRSGRSAERLRLKVAGHVEMSARGDPTYPVTERPRTHAMPGRTASAANGYRGCVVVTRQTLRMATPVSSPRQGAAAPRGRGRLSVALGAISACPIQGGVPGASRLPKTAPAVRCADIRGAHRSCCDPSWCLLAGQTPKGSGVSPRVSVCWLGSPDGRGFRGLVAECASSLRRRH